MIAKQTSDTIKPLKAPETENKSNDKIVNDDELLSWQNIEEDDASLNEMPAVIKQIEPESVESNW